MMLENLEMIQKPKLNTEFFELIQYTIQVSGCRSRSYRRSLQFYERIMS